MLRADRAGGARLAYLPAVPRSGSWLFSGTAMVVRSAQGSQHGLTRLRERDCVVLHDLVQQDLQKLRGSPGEHDAVIASPGGRMAQIWVPSGSIS